MTESLLTLVDAQKRFNQIQQGISYRFFFNFKKGERYQGLLEASFKFNDIGSDTWLDFEGESVDKLWINGSEIEAASVVHENHRIVLSKDKLSTTETNIVTVQFTNKYSRDGNGLQGYTDNEDKQYLYTQTEPFYGNKVCPLFDQPDLKATYELFAVGPTDWNIVTSEIQIVDSTYGEFLSGEIAADDAASTFIQGIKSAYPDVDGGFKFFRFAVTKILSTYLNNIIGGPYKRFDAPAEELYRGIPMAVYCRANLAHFVEPQLHDIFAFHAKGIEFYEKFFSFDYPFSKCDAIFCAEYTVGAMEYPGSITYSEQRYFYRKLKPSLFEISNRGRVIMHELAHMWFGNAVTMKWWDDLWLNESFADFSCFQCWEGLRKTLDFPISDGWIAFLNRKGWAFKEDQERTTHPISCVVNNTEEANHIFDGITYPKGAMCMRQLMILLGEEYFSKALGNYFNKFAWKNTVLNDLFEACKEVVDPAVHVGEAYDLDKWKASFLDNPGMNMITSEWDPSNSNKVTIRQTAANPDYPTLRYHKIHVAFYNESGEIVEEQDVLLNNSEVTEIEFDQSKNPTAVFLNHGDWAFIKIDFDSQSYNSLKNSFSKLDNLSKALFARSRYDAVRDARIPVSEFLETFFAIFEQEGEAEVLEYLLNVVTPVISKYVQSSDYAATTTKIFNIIVAKLSATDDFDTVQLLKGAFLSFLYSEESISVARQWYEGSHDLSKHELSLREKWTIVYAIHGSNTISVQDKARILVEAIDADSTDCKDEFCLKINALQANTAQRESLFQQYLNCDTMSFKEMQYSITGFISKWVPANVKQTYHDRFFENFLKVKADKSYQFFLVWRRFLFPRTKNKTYLIQKIKELLPQVEGDAVMKKALLQTLDDEERSAKVLGIDF